MAVLSGRKASNNSQHLTRYSEDSVSYLAQRSETPHRPTQAFTSAVTHKRWFKRDLLAHQTQMVFWNSLQPSYKNSALPSSWHNSECTDPCCPPTQSWSYAFKLNTPGKFTTKSRLTENTSMNPHGIQPWVRLQQAERQSSTDSATSHSCKV